MGKRIQLSDTEICALLDAKNCRLLRVQRLVNPQPIIARDGHGIMVDDPTSALPAGQQQIYAQAETMKWGAPYYDNGDGCHSFHTNIESGIRLMEACCPYGLPGDQLQLGEASVQISDVDVLRVDESSPWMWEISLKVLSIGPCH